MLKRHCDLCDLVIGDFKTRYKLVMVRHKMFSDMEEVKMEICERCLDKIVKAREQNNDN